MLRSIQKLTAEFDLWHYGENQRSNNDKKRKERKKEWKRSKEQEFFFSGFSIRWQEKDVLRRKEKWHICRPCLLFQFDDLFVRVHLTTKRQKSFETRKRNKGEDCVSVCVHVCLCVSVYVCTWVHMCVCVCVCAAVCHKLCVGGGWLGGTGTSLFASTCTDVQSTMHNKKKSES